MAETTISQVKDLLTTAFPWVVFLGMLAVVLRVIGALDLALGRQQGIPPRTPPPAPLPVPEPTRPPLIPAPIPVPLPVPRPPPTLPLPSPPIVITGPWANAPPWMIVALHDIGFHETGNNQGIGRFIALAHTGSEGDPWCAISLNAWIEMVGLRGTRSPSSQSFKFDPNFVQLPGPALGALAIFWRGTRPTDPIKYNGQGHVAIYVDEDATHIRALGGNENDMVQIEPLPKAGSSSGLIGYWWPKSFPLPTIGPIATPAGAPIHVQVDPTGGAAAPPLVPALPAQPVSIHDSPKIEALKAANAQRWAAMHVKADRLAAFDATAKRLSAADAKARYEKISATTGVPWFVIAVIHEREASGQWDKQLGQGDPLNAVSTHEPKGRGPFTGADAFYDAAVDALTNCGPYAAKWKDWSIGGMLTILEEYNGLGYANRGVPSAYVWSGTDQYTAGKFIADHVYSASAIDVQEGCAPLLARMAAIDQTITLGSQPAAEAVSVT